MLDPRPVSCAIHQPNLLPRMSTLAKIAAADIWVVLDTVQFARRDWQHRTRIAALDEPEQHRWLSVETHLPSGRATAIGQAVTADPARAARRVSGMLADAYKASPYWAVIDQIRRATLSELAATGFLARVATASTAAILDAIGWKGTIVRASALDARSDRTERLVDLCQAVGAEAYLCGTGGLRYVEASAFARSGIDLVPFQVPSADARSCWTLARRITGLWALAAFGPNAVAQAVADLATSRGLAAPIEP
jgi:hypothetical protein